MTGSLGAVMAHRSDGLLGPRLWSGDWGSSLSLSWAAPFPVLWPQDAGLSWFFLISACWRFRLQVSLAPSPGPRGREEETPGNTPPEVPSQSAFHLPISEPFDHCLLNNFQLNARPDLISARLPMVAGDVSSLSTATGPPGFTVSPESQPSTSLECVRF